MHNIRPKLKWVTVLKLSFPPLITTKQFSSKNISLSYKQYNLFEPEELYFDFAKEPQFVNFNTSFGRFGIITCADILNFREPAISLVEVFRVDTILFPTAWTNGLPLLSAIQYHSAWAMGMRVNLLSANIHKPSLDLTGNHNLKLNH